MKDTWMRNEWYLIKYMQNREVTQFLGAYDVLHLVQIITNGYSDRDCKNWNGL